jgi:hypothetical protein
VVWLEREKKGQEPLRVFKVFTALQLLININRNGALPEKGMEVAMFLTKANGQFCLASFGSWPHFMDFLLHLAIY